jgi:antitoxin ParD1/3/4
MRDAVWWYKMPMETVQIRLTEKQLRRLDVMVKNGVYPNRSEAVRDAVRKLIGNEE